MTSRITTATIKNGKPKLFKCTEEGCSATFTKNRALVNHGRKHIGEVNYLKNI